MDRHIARREKAEADPNQSGKHFEAVKEMPV